MTQPKQIVDYINKLASSKGVSEEMQKEMFHVINMVHELKTEITVKVDNLRGRQLIDKPTNEQAFIHLFNEFAGTVHNNAVAHGWWDVDPVLAKISGDVADKYGLDSPEYAAINKKLERNAGEAYMLMVSELAEVLENDRAGNTPDSHLTQYPGNQVELADVVIRVMDWVAAHGYNLGEIIVAKHKYNTKRPYKHGKKL
jgi:hypothetical protein